MSRKWLMWILAVALIAGCLAITNQRALAAEAEQNETQAISEEAEEEYEDTIDVLSKVVWGEARGLGKAQKAAVVWCILNRVDSGKWKPTPVAVATSRHQFCYSARFPVTEENAAIVRDVLLRWELEKLGMGDVGRILPSEYTFFAGNGKENVFRTKYRGGTRWNWSLNNPYEAQEVTAKAPELTELLVSAAEEN